MGADYNKIISSLILFKEDLDAIDDKKYHDLITVLKEYEICIDDEKWNIPDKKELAEKLNISYSKSLLLFKGLYEKFLEYYSDNILEFNEFEQEIHIHIPYEEKEKDLLKRNPNYYFKNSTYLKVKLPFIPRIGEEISLDFIESGFGANRGYVHEVRHVLMGKRQIIEIIVHPSEDYYHKWKKMEEKFKERQLWLKWIRSEK